MNDLPGARSEGLATQVWRLGLGSLIYAASTLLAQAIQFCLVPIYSRVLTPADYGVLALTGTLQHLLAIVLGLALYSGCGRLYLDAATQKARGALLGTILLSLVLVGGMLAATIEWLGSGGHLNFFAQVPYDPYLRLTLWTSFLSLFPVILVTTYTMDQRPRMVMFLSLLNVAVSTILGLCLVVWLRRGAQGSLEASLLANALMTAASIAILRRAFPFSWSSATLGAALRYSFPIVPHLLAIWALGLSDRIILESHATMRQLGLYSVGAQIAGIVLSMEMAIHSAVSPRVLELLRRGESGDVPTLGTYALSAMAVIALAAALLGGEALRLLTPPSYHEAAHVIPLLALGYWLQGVYFVASLGTWHSMRTSLVPLCTGIAAACNVALNLWTIPRWGIAGAALTMIFSNGLLALLHGLLAQRLAPIPWQYGRWLRLGLAAVISYGLGTFVQQNLALSLLSKVGALVLAFPLVLTLTGFVQREEWLFLRQRMRSKLTHR